MGKVPEGIVEGKLYWIGSYEYCEDTRVEYWNNLSYVPERRQYEGQYSRIQLRGNSTVSISINKLSYIVRFYQ